MARRIFYAYEVFWMSCDHVTATCQVRDTAMIVACVMLTIERANNELRRLHNKSSSHLDEVGRLIPGPWGALQALATNSNFSYWSSRSVVGLSR